MGNEPSFHLSLWRAAMYSTSGRHKYLTVEALGRYFINRHIREAIMQFLANAAAMPRNQKEVGAVALRQPLPKRKSPAHVNAHGVAYPDFVPSSAGHNRGIAQFGDAEGRGWRRRSRSNEPSLRRPRPSPRRPRPEIHPVNRGTLTPLKNYAMLQSERSPERSPSSLSGQRP